MRTSRFGALDSAAWAIMLFVVALPVVRGQSGESEPSSQPASRQSDPPTVQRAADEAKAESILAGLDARLYRARSAGLTDVRFRWNARGDGYFAGVDFWVEFGWRDTGQEFTRLVDVNGRTMTTADLPPSLVGRPAELQLLVSHVRALAHTCLIGLPFAAVYRDYYKDVTEREVNNKIETSVIMVPKSKKLNAKVVIRIRDGLPFEIVKTSMAGHENHLRYRYEKRDEKWLLKGFSSEVGNTIMQEEEYDYVVMKDIIVLSGLTRMTRQTEVPKQVVKLEDLRINEGIPDILFVAPTGDAQAPPPAKEEKR